VGKPYLEIRLDRRALARYGLRVNDVQELIEVAIGGRPITTTVEGRERYPVRVRYPRELRGTIEDLERVLVTTMDGVKIPLSHLAEIRYVRGPEAIKSEDTFLIGYTLFDKLPRLRGGGRVEAWTVICARRSIPANSFGRRYTYSFAGDYENQLRAQRTLMLVLPLSLFIIFILLYFQFRSVLTTTIVFSGIAVAWAGGFTMIWLYGQEWFANFAVLRRQPARPLSNCTRSTSASPSGSGSSPCSASPSDDGVVIATYLRQSFAARTTLTIAQIREATIAAGLRRIRPCLMTSATTILALLPVLTSTGRGADIMIPMAIPIFGGMTLAFLTMFTVPVLYCLAEEWSSGCSARVFRSGCRCCW
jgi:copper/silver efflux system protein